jgi:UDP-N-acetylmuramoylalanine--D-glutamate ligase
LLAEGLRTFRALAHRLELVREAGGVLWINDSKATNIASTVVAVAAMDRPFVLLLGGRHKGEPYTRLGPLLRERCRLVIAYGEAGPLVRRDLAGTVPLEAGTTFEDVLGRAARAARRGDAVLLSPACSSYDMFKNYEERGATFRRYVEAL